ncbi:MAG TPA: hypothetical protein DC064_29725, partial [Cyanobacteria bacterium UBA9273]|nr:hypothetical protein [Cyanobacteria bacterium UBA9273]
LIYLAFLKPGIWGFDGNDMLAVSRSLVTEGDFSIGRGEGVLGRDGQYYSIRYPLLPIVAMPFVAIGLALANSLNLPATYVAAVCALVLCILITALTTSMVALLALRLGSSQTGAYLAAICFAFGTTALVYAREFFAEPLLSFLTVCSLYLTLGKTSRAHAGGSILAGLAVTAKPAGIVVGPVLSAYLLLKRYPLRNALGPFLGTVMGFMLYMAYNYLRFGDLLSSGQKASNFALEGTLERFLGLIFSPGAGGGLIWYCPPVILAIIGFRKAFKSKPLEALAIVGIFAGYWVLHSFWEFGGWSWGPRFLVPALPGLMALTALIDRKWWKGLIGLTVLGFLANAPSLVSYYQRYYAEASDGKYLTKALNLWAAPTDTPLFNAWGAAYRQIQDALANNVKDIIKQSGAAPGPGKLATAELLRIVAVWWWLLPAAGIPLWVGVVLAALLVGGGVWVLRLGWLDACKTSPSPET